jgi:uroporphyrinogen decarboxylase
MQTNCLNQLVLNSPQRLALPIAVYPGLAITGARVSDVVTNPQAQFEAQAALHARYRTPFVLSAMDLSAEAEAFGCALHLSDAEVPSVVGRLVTTPEQARRLVVPQPGDMRTRVYLETVARLRAQFPRTMVLGGCIGPFSLAARLAGVSEAMELTATEPAMIHTLIEKSAAFLLAYARAFKKAGADGLIMAEPAAGLLSPRSLGTFSSAYIKSMGEALEDGHFALILHNCGARLLHLPAILQTGLKSFHFGSPMDLTGALEKVEPDTVLCGNLDPSSVFCQLPPAEVTARAAGLLAATAQRRNFVLSSGCDVPPLAPLASLDAFYEALHCRRDNGRTER